MTDKMKHTPGPWQVSYETDISGFENDPENGCIGLVDVAHVYMRTVPCRHEANARLIAAAPELLEALREALEWMESDWQKIDYEWGPTMEKFGDLEGAIQQRHPSTDAIRSARAAIAKATGGNDAK